MEGVLGVRRDERQTLDGFLDRCRAVVEHNLEGLTYVQATAPMAPSGLSLLGAIEHPGWVERVGSGRSSPVRDVTSVGVAGDNAAGFAIDPGDSADSVVAFSRAGVGHARRIAAAAPSLDALSARSTGLGAPVRLRWIMSA